MRLRAGNVLVPSARERCYVAGINLFQTSRNWPGTIPSRCVVRKARFSGEGTRGKFSFARTHQNASLVANFIATDTL